ncbi:MAG: glycosidase, partial [Chloroflexi bacterium]|nr:glycosidase [Chloroflexota bacterium]
NRPRDWIMAPEERWELQGNVPNVVFSSANIRVGNQVWIYYGGADHAIGLATGDFDALLEFARFG